VRGIFGLNWCGVVEDVVGLGFARGRGRVVLVASGNVVDAPRRSEFEEVIDEDLLLREGPMECVSARDASAGVLLRTVTNTIAVAMQSAIASQVVVSRAHACRDGIAAGSRRECSARGVMSVHARTAPTAG
jgi:hypothetical protein